MKPIPFSLQVNLLKTKTTDSFPPGCYVPVAEDIDVDSFTYLGVDIHNTGSTEHDIRKCIAIARNCMSSIDRNIWHSSISLTTKPQLHRVFFLPAIRYGAEIWLPTRQLSRNIDAFDQWCLHHTLQISWRDQISNKKHLKNVGPIRYASRFTLSFTRCRYCRHCRTPPAHRCPRRRQQRVTERTAMAPWNGPNEEVRRRTDQPPLTCIIHTTHLKFFGHIAHADRSMDHSRALRSSVAPLPSD